MNQQVDVRRLRYFIAVGEELHFGRAADRLGMAQPPLTQQIQKLEHELGCKVFSREGRKTTPGACFSKKPRRFMESTTGPSSACAAPVAVKPDRSRAAHLRR